jgi:predicted ATPase
VHADLSHTGICRSHKENCLMFDLRVRNFRGFVDQEFQFRKVNILIGENSGGKSSVIKLLLALKQSFLDPRETGRNNLTLSGWETDLGTFRDIIHKHSTRRRLGIGFTTDPKYGDFFLEEFRGRGRLGSSRRFVVTRPGEATNRYRQERIEKNKKASSRFIGSPVHVDYSFSNDLTNHADIQTTFSNEIIGSLSIEFSSISDEPAEYSFPYVAGTCTLVFESNSSGKTFKLRKLPFQKDAFSTIIDGEDMKTALSKLKLADEEAIFTEIAYLLTAQEYIATTIQSLEYVNPLLSEPAERIYVRGDDKIIANLSDLNKLVSFLSSPSQRKFLESLNKALRTFGIVDSVYPIKNDYTTELRVVQNGLESNIKDVGFGVSLQIPIFAQALRGQASKRGQIMIIEQPEVHLHPRLQATFIDALLTLTENQPLFIETHSEHIVRMLQLIVKEGRHNLTADDVSIHYFRKEGARQKVTRHQINQESGRLKPPFPPGFYDVSYNLAFKLMN